MDDAFWWSVSTISTVGYGDVYPVTTEGKIIATIIMFTGIGILGTFISTVGAKLISEKFKKDVATVRDDTKRLIKERIDKIELLNQKDFDLLIRMMDYLREEKANLTYNPEMPYWQQRLSYVHTKKNIHDSLLGSYFSRKSELSFGSLA